jgi:hypothetical protein
LQHTSEILWHTSWESQDYNIDSGLYSAVFLIWNKEELPHQWKESIVVPIHKKGDKTDCSNY